MISSSFFSFKNVQNKQGSLLQRVDSLDRENQELKDQVAILEEEKEEIEESLKAAKKQVTQLQRDTTEKQVHDCVKHMFIKLFD